MENCALIDEILFALVENKEITTKENFHSLKNSIFSKYKTPHGMNGTVMLDRYKALIESGEMKEEERIWKLLRKRAVRSLSGISVISLLTKFW